MVAAGFYAEGLLDFLRGILLLLATMAAAAAVIVSLARWIKRPKARSGDDLTYFRLLYEQGEFSREEYEQIRRELGTRMRKELDLPAPAGETLPRPADPELPPDTRIQTGNTVSQPPRKPPADGI